ncbi:MAG TPA: DUF2997 domain-containing protein [Candidatus Wallbacteria bacterium]|nr:DUF2997 domain-containing protein [Candidatus Wallbacteria bacterium]
MTPKHEIDIEITETGEVKAHIKGIPGKGCAEIGKILKDIVGEVKSESKTSEYYQPEPRIDTRVEGKK